MLDRRVAYVRVLMAVKLGEQAWRSSLLQSSQWQLRIMAERNGEYVLTVPVPLESVWRRFFGGQLWIRANISRQELNKFLEISQGGGVLSKDPNHLWISLCQGASRLVGGLGGDESVAFTTLMPLLFYKYYCKADEGRRSHWRWWRDFFCGSDVDGCHEPAPQIYRRHEFDVEFGRMEPDGVIYTPWEDQGGYGAVLWQHIASILSGMASEFGGALGGDGDERRRCYSAMGASGCYIPLHGRILPSHFSVACLTIPGRGGGYDGIPSPSSNGTADDGQGEVLCDPTLSGDGIVSQRRNEVHAQLGEANQHEVQTQRDGSDGTRTEESKRAGVNQQSGNCEQNCGAGIANEGVNTGSDDGGPLQPTREGPEGENEGLDRHAQSKPKQVPLAAHPPKCFERDIGVVRDAIVHKFTGPHRSGGDEGTSGALSSQDEQRNGEVRGVRGRVFGADHPLASEVCGVQVGPLNRPDPTIYTDCAENIEAAIRERIEKKQKPCTLTTEDRKRLGTFINTACGIGEHKTKDRTVFSKEKLEKVMQDLAHLGDIKSKKWSVMRFREAFQKLMRKYDPKFVLGAKIKIEPMGEGKAPRLPSRANRLYEGHRLYKTCAFNLVHCQQKHCDVYCWCQLACGTGTIVLLVSVCCLCLSWSERYT